MREQKFRTYLSWMSLLLMFGLAGCFMDAGSQQAPAATGVVQVATAQSTQEVIIDASPTLEDAGLPTETPADLPLMPTETPADLPLMPTETPADLPLLPTETPAEVGLIPTETPAELPLFPTETPFEVIVETDVLVPTSDDALFVSSTPPQINFDVPTATTEVVVVVPTTDPGQLFVSSTPPQINFDVPTATPEVIVVVPTQEILFTPETIDQGGGDIDLVAAALATATAVTNLYNQSISGASVPPNLPPVIAPLGQPVTPLPAECLMPEYVSMSQVIGAPSLIVQFTVLDPNPDYNYTWMALVDGRLNVVGAATGATTTLSFNQRGTYEMRLQVRLAPGKELVAADGTRQNCQADLIIEQKITVVG